MFALLALMLCTSGVPLLISPSTARADAHVNAAGEDTRGENYWRQRQSKLTDAVTQGEIRAEEARNAYTLMMSNDYPKGDRRAEIREERDAAEQDLADARAALDAFPEEARQAGVPPGSLR